MTKIMIAIMMITNIVVVLVAIMLVVAADRQYSFLKYHIIAVNHHYVMRSLHINFVCV